jgi:hypothetical protein
MSIDPNQANELASLARQAGAEILEGKLRYPSPEGGWQLGELDLGAMLEGYRDQRLMVLLLPLGKAETGTVTCDDCGFSFVLDESGECPRCKLIVDYTTDSLERRVREREQLIEEYLDNE